MLRERRCLSGYCMAHLGQLTFNNPDVLTHAAGQGMTSEGKESTCNDCPYDQAWGNCVCGEG